MTRPHRPLPVVLGAALVGVALLLASCGDDDDSDDAATTSSSTTSTTSDGDGTTAPPTTAPPPLGDVAVSLTPIADVANPTAMAVRAGDPALYVAEQAGRVKAIGEGRPAAGDVVLDLSSRTTGGGERGLLGIAFSPDGAQFYTSYTNLNGDSRIDEYDMVDDRPDPGSRREVLAVAQPYPNHNGGNIAFGPDGNLWFGLGDGGSGGDPLDHGQDTSTLLGSLLRIDPSGGDPYAIPAGNPFADGREGRPEIMAYGLRNPWRFSFDRATGDLWIGDVGQGDIEEIDFLPAGQAAGANLGWNRLEGTRRFEGQAPAGAVPPVFEYTHGDGCSVTGGYVYRGRSIPGLVGAYVFADYCAGQVRAVRLVGGQIVDESELGVEAGQLASFGEDAGGELYVLSFDDGLLRIDAG